MSHDRYLGNKSKRCEASVVVSICGKHGELDTQIRLGLINALKYLPKVRINGNIRLGSNNSSQFAE